MVSRQVETKTLILTACHVGLSIHLHDTFISDLTCILPQERSVQNESLDSHRGQNLSGELIKSKDHRSRYHLELDETKEQLRLEQLRVKQITDQVENLVVDL